MEQQRNRRASSGQRQYPRQTRRRRRRRSSPTRRVLLLLIVIGCVLGVVASCRQRSRNRQVVNDSAEPAARSEQRTDPEVTREAYIASHKTEYPQSLREMLERNPETVDFVYDYPKEGEQAA